MGTIACADWSTSFKAYGMILQRYGQTRLRETVGESSEGGGGISERRLELSLSGTTLDLRAVMRVVGKISVAVRWTSDTLLF